MRANADRADGEGFKVTVYRAGSNGTIKPIATTRGSAMGAEGVAVDSSGKVYVTTQFGKDADNDIWGEVTIFSPLGNGEIRTIATIYTIAKTGLGSQSGIALDSKETMWRTLHMDL